MSYELSVKESGTINLCVAAIHNSWLFTLNSVRPLGPVQQGAVNSARSGRKQR